MYSIQSCEKNHKYRIVYSIFLENEGGPGDGSVGPPSLAVCVFMQKIYKYALIFCQNNLYLEKDNWIHSECWGSFKLRR